MNGWERDPCAYDGGGGRSYPHAAACGSPSRRGEQAFKRCEILGRCPGSPGKIHGLRGPDRPRACVHRRSSSSKFLPGGPINRLIVIATAAPRSASQQRLARRPARPATGGRQTLQVDRSTIATVGTDRRSAGRVTDVQSRFSVWVPRGPWQACGQVRGLADRPSAGMLHLFRSAHPRPRGPVAMPDANLKVFFMDRITTRPHR